MYDGRVSRLVGSGRWEDGWLLCLQEMISQLIIRGLLIVQCDLFSCGRYLVSKAKFA